MLNMMILYMYWLNIMACNLVNNKDDRDKLSVMELSGFQLD